MNSKNVQSLSKKNLNDFFLYLTSVLREFGIFIYILIRPWTVLSFALTVLLIWFTQSQTGTNRLIWEITATIFGGVVGGLITNYLIEHTGNTFLVKKSIGAIRNLQLIKSKVKNINDRIVELKKPSNARDFDEIENLVDNIHKDTLNSISDWSDVNPNSETITDFYELIAIKEESIKKLKSDKIDLEDQKKSLAQDKKEEIERLEKEISEKTQGISKLRNQINNLSQNNIGIMSGSVLSMPSISTVGPINNSLPLLFCKKCGKQFQQSMLSVVGRNDLCDTCRGYIDL